MKKTVLKFLLATPLFIYPALLYAQSDPSQELPPVQKSTSSCSISPTTQLRSGSEDKGGRDDVMRLQRVLQEENFLKAVPNGYFGVGTKSAVRAFQKKNGIRSTGIVGPLTLTRVNDIACKNTIPRTEPITQPEVTISTVIKVPEAPVITKDQPTINSFSIVTTSSGSQSYSANIQNVDAISMTAVCPSGIIEVKNSVGLIKSKLPFNESVCQKEKYLYLADTSELKNFERVSSGMVFLDRAGSPSWFAFDATTTPSITRIPVVLKACLKSTCIKKSYTVDVRDFFQTVASTELSLSNVRIDESRKNILFTATNFNKITIRPGCPYNVQALDSAGSILLEESTYCGVEKELVPYQEAKISLYEKPSGDSIKDLGYNFEMKTVNGQMDAYANVELTLRACSGKQAESVSSSTLRCVEKMTSLPIYKK